MYIMLPFLFNNLGWIPSNLWGTANEPTVVLGSKPHQFDLHCHGYSKCNYYLVVSRSRNQQRNYRSKLQSFRTWTPIWSHCYSIGSPILWTVNKIQFISYLSLNVDLSKYAWFFQQIYILNIVFQVHMQGHQPSWGSFHRDWVKRGSRAFHFATSRNRQSHSDNNSIQICGSTRHRRTANWLVLRRI